MELKHSQRVVLSTGTPDGVGLRIVDDRSTNPALVYLASLSPGSRPTAEAALHEMAFFVSNGELDAFRFPWGALRYEHTSAIRTFLLMQPGRADSQAAATTVRKKLSFLRGVLKEAWRLHQIDGEAYHRAIDLPKVRGSSARDGRALAADELRALLQVCDEDPSPAGRRDAALFAIGYGGGLRRVEIAGLDVSDVVRLTRVRIRRGKGNKQAWQALPPGVGPRIRAWLDVRGSDPGPLWYPIRKNGVLVVAAARNGNPRRLSLRAVSRIVDKRRAQAGLEPFRVHDLRRSFITHVLERTGDLAQAQRLARHNDPKTTALYDRRSEDADRAAVDLLELPSLS